MPIASKSREGISMGNHPFSKSSFIEKIPSASSFKTALISSVTNIHARISAFKFLNQPVLSCPMSKKFKDANQSRLHQVTKSVSIPAKRGIPLHGGSGRGIIGSIRAKMFISRCHPSVRCTSQPAANRRDSSILQTYIVAFNPP